MNKKSVNVPHASRIIKTGDKIPPNIFKILDGDVQSTITSDEVFNNNKVVLFSVFILCVVN